MRRIRDDHVSAGEEIARSMAGLCRQDTGNDVFLALETLPSVGLLV